MLIFYIVDHQESSSNRKLRLKVEFRLVSSLILLWHLHNSVTNHFFQYFFKACCRIHQNASTFKEWHWNTDGWFRSFRQSDQTNVILIKRQSHGSFYDLEFQCRVHFKPIFRILDVLEDAVRNRKVHDIKNRSQERKILTTL